MVILREINIKQYDAMLQATEMQYYAVGYWNIII